MATSSVTSSSSASSVNGSALMKAIGAGSGLDVSSIVSQLMTVEQQPITQLQKQQSSYQTRISALGTLSSAVTRLQTAVKSLVDPATFASLGATSSNSATITAAATSDAAPGSYAINVTQTAQAQIKAGPGLASSSSAESATASTGTFTLKVGSGAPTTVTIDAGNNTLAGMARAINAANSGVTATVVNDGSDKPYRLVLSAKASGSANTVSLDTSNLAAGELHDVLDGLTEVVPARNANLTVNGIAVTSASNTVDGAIPGVSLDLQGTGSSTVTVAANSDTMITNVSNFVGAYNTLSATVRNLSTYDATSKTAGPLNGNSTTRNLMSQLRSIVSGAVSGMGSGPSTLGQIGVTLKSDGSLFLDATKLGKAITDDLPGLASVLGGAKGFATQIDSFATNALGKSGAIANETSGLNASITGIDGRISDINRRLVQVEANYKAQFGALDSMLASMTKTQDYLKQQFDLLFNTKNN